MEKLASLQKRILTDPETRKAFCADPRGFMRDAGIPVPHGVTIPESIPVAALDAQVAHLQAHLEQRGMTLEEFQARHAASLTDSELEAVAGGSGSETPSLVVVSVYVAVVTAV